MRCVLLAAAAVLAMLVVGCAHRGAESVELPPAAVPELVGRYSEQALFRVDVDSDETSGRMRLVLRDDPTQPRSGFHLAAADPLGRPLWALAAVAGRWGLVDHRSGAFCQGDAASILPGRALAGLPPASLPRVLRGRLPVEPPGGSAAADFRDARDRRWTTTIDEAGPVSWALWEEGRPLLWWSRQQGGGVLSHRQGTQFRWRLSVRESVSGEFSLAVPPDYHRADCAEWDVSQLRKDQPAPAGDGAAR